MLTSAAATTMSATATAACDHPKATNWCTGATPVERSDAALTLACPALVAAIS
jgi:hypothetical protein